MPIPLRGSPHDAVGLRRWDNCFIRLLDGMLQVAGFAGSDSFEHSLRIPVRIRQIEIRAPGGTAAPAVACAAQRALGRVVTPLATLQGLELAAAPRSAAVATSRCAPGRFALLFNAPTPQDSLVACACLCKAGGADAAGGC